MKSALVLLSLLFSFPLLAAEMELAPVGDFGGLRLRTACALEGTETSCLVDTGAGDTILAETEASLVYPSLGKVSLQGVGSTAFICDRVRPTSFSLRGLIGNEVDFLRCPGFPAQNSPMIGLNFFRDRAVSFLFRGRQLNWSLEDTSSFSPFSMEGKHGRYMTFQSSMGEAGARVFFDTGNPVTMVRPDFVAAHPELFAPSDRPRSEMMIRNGFYGYKALRPIVVHGIELQAVYVYSADLSPILGDAPMDMILGMNHIANADWIFDLKNLRFRVNK